MSSDVNLSSGAGFAREAQKWRWRLSCWRLLVSIKQCARVECNWMKLGQGLNDVHVADIFIQPKMMANVTRMGFDIWAGLRHVAQMLEPEGSSGHREASTCCWITTVQSFHENSIRGPEEPNFRQMLDRGVRQLKTLLAVYSSQMAQRRWFLREDPHHKWSWNVKDMHALMKSTWRSSDGNEAHDQ